MEALRILCKDRRLDKGAGQRLPQKDVRIEVNERAILKALSDQLAQGPPLRVHIFQSFQFC